MADITVAATVSRKVAAPRETIVAWELDPRNTARIEPRMVISDLVWQSEGRAATWTTSVSRGLFKVSFHSVVMAIDPVIVELRNKHRRQTSTVTVSDAPDESGRFTMSYAVEVVAKATWLTRLQRNRYQAATERSVQAQIDAAVALIEEDARAATEATESR